ncbi:MAG TPA: 2-amino-4-hydroxy-6-hydroxymethyldihydropteridine diphosphokinase [Vicinamibacterales bacterium]|jgi:2-amino-4-hydroxy-6-hydroxymethyldihydropteridine diphosphokinase|nr:2-amino-4-hydroxy-6-hydroxymethyldihydropteridine diphosphokinase [Vicinamibacterales bacterium]
MRVAIALGSNLGDRRAHLTWATGELERVVNGLIVSEPIETKPVGAGLEHDPEFLNAAAVGESDLPPAALVAALLDIERRRGRERPHANAPRTLDLDLILAGDQIIDAPGVQVPHPRFRERRFVLEPLASIAPDIIDPVTSLTVAELLDLLD